MAALKGVATAVAIIIGMLLVFVPAKGLTWLAGGGDNAIDATYMLWPIAIFAFVIGFYVDRLMKDTHRYGRKARAVGFPIMFTLIIWYCLPMGMNGISTILRANGLEHAGKVVYDLRWLSMPGIIVLWLGWALLRALIKDMRRLPVPRDPCDNIVNKLPLVFAISIAFFSASAQADTEYLDLSGLKPTPLEQWKDGKVAAAALSDWEKKNPDKKIISVSANIVSRDRHDNMGSVILGFWVIFDKKDALTLQKEKEQHRINEEFEHLRQFVSASR